MHGNYLEPELNKLIPRASPLNSNSIVSTHTIWEVPCGALRICQKKKKPQTKNFCLNGHGLIGKTENKHPLKSYCTLDIGQWVATVYRIIKSGLEMNTEELLACR